jgi:LacI family transcriptional regulator/LacI family repressor for deo operon, udp, cdd, tsx, nupC, and nupG
VGRVLRGVEDVAQGANVSVFLSVSHNNPERELEVIETFHRRRVDGVISATAQIRGSYVQRLGQLNLPTVLINQQAEPETELLHSVDVDDYSGARQAVEHLLALGHRRIGYLGVDNRYQSNQRRLEGYWHTLAVAGITPQDQWRRTIPSHRFHTEHDVLAAQAMLPELLQEGVTAVFCYNDLVAVGVLLACRELGLRVPDQLSVVGYDDVDLARYVTPPLTTVHQPKLRLGELAMQMLLDVLVGQPVANQMLPVDLVVRASTGPYRKNYLDNLCGVC